MLLPLLLEDEKSGDLVPLIPPLKSLDAKMHSRHGQALLHTMQEANLAGIIDAAMHKAAARAAELGQEFGT